MDGNPVVINLDALPENFVIAVMAMRETTKYVYARHYGNGYILASVEEAPGTPEFEAKDKELTEMGYMLVIGKPSTKPKPKDPVTFRARRW